HQDQHERFSITSLAAAGPIRCQTHLDPPFRSFPLPTARVPTRTDLLPWNRVGWEPPRRSESTGDTPDASPASFFRSSPPLRPPRPSPLPVRRVSETAWSLRPPWATPRAPRCPT